MKKLILLTGLAAFAFGARAQKTINDGNAEVRAVSGFNAIEISDGIDLYLSQGDEAVAVSAGTTQLRDGIVTEVVNGVLKIYLRHERAIRITWGRQTRKGSALRAYVSSHNLEKLVAGGGSDVRVDGQWKTNKLQINISGGADFSGAVAAAELQADASGGSDFYISGTATSLRLRASGGSDFRGYNLVVDSGDVNASGGSDVNLTANKELNVEASGGSDVYYRGTAVIRNIRSSGGGSVKKTSK